MAPQQKLELVVLNLTFSKNVHPLAPGITRIRKTHLSNSMIHVQDWYDRTMLIEKAKIPLPVQVSYCEWNITSGNVDLFIMDGYNYEKILLILGEDVVHWVYYENMPAQRRLEGRSTLTVNYCSCCLDNQYLEIMANVKDGVIRGGLG